ncbi:MAG: PAS domain S-box protein [Chlorobi bacterium]|nr:PAS domain S-box protein [Chlorobiota bacterium]
MKKKNFVRDVKEELQKREGSYKTFFDEAFDGFYIMKIDPPVPINWGVRKQLKAMLSGASIVECNKSFAEMYGAENCRKFIGKSMLEMYGGKLSETNEAVNISFIKNGYRLTNDLTAEPDLHGKMKYFVNNSIGIIENKKLTGIWGTQKDITELIEMQNDLKVSEELFRSIFQSVNDGIFIKDQNGAFILVNPAFMKIIQQSKKNIIGKTGKEIFGEKYSQASERSDEKVLSGRSVSYKDKRIINGKEIFLQVTKVPLRNMRGKITGVLGIGRDITESETVILKLTEREKEFETLINVNPVPILVADENFKTRLVNQQFVKTFGYSKEDVSSLDDWLKKAYPENKNIGKVRNEWINSLKKTVSRRKIIHYTESKVACKDGSEKYIEFHATYIGKLIVVSFIDMTARVRTLQELQKSEQYFKTIFYNVPYGVLHFDKESVITACNDLLVKMLGSSKKALIGLNMFKQLRDEKLLAAIRKMFRVGSATYQDYYVSVTGRNVVPMKIQFKNIKNDKGEIIGGVGVIEDITERIEREKAIKQSEQKYKRIFDGVSDAIFIHEPDSIKIIDVNVRVTQMYGYSRKELIGGSLKKLSAEANKYSPEEALKLIKEAVKKPQHFEWLAKDSKGKIFWVDVNLRKIIINGDVKILAAVKNINERKKAINNLTESEARFRLLLESSPDATIVHSNGIFVYVNKAAVKLSGVKSKNDLIGKPVLPFIHPESRPFAIKRMKTVKKFLPPAEEKFLRADGKTINVEVSGVKITFNQKPAIQLIIRDITEKKQQQAIQNALFKISQASVQAKDLNHFFKNVHDILKQIIFAENFYIALIDKSRNELSFPYFVDEYDEQPKQRPFKKGFTEYVIKRRKSVFIDAEKDKKLRASGKVDLIGAYSKMWIGVILKYQEEVIGVMAIQDYHSSDTLGKEEMKILTFVSEQIAQVIVKMKSEEEKDSYLNELQKTKKELEKQTEQLKIINKELRDSEEKLKIINANKDKFFSIVSHDLRSPFSALIGYAQLLTDNYNELEDDEIQMSLASLKRSAENTFSLLNGLLEWSRTQTGRMEFNPRYYKLYKIANSVVDLLKVSAKNKQIILAVKIPEEIKVYADRKMLETILRNLVSNAIKFTSPGGKVILQAKERKNEILISVADNGMGIEDDDLKKLFKIEEHHTTVGTENEVGTGVGLILCKELVEKMGGKIWVKSKIGFGATFYVTLKKRK